MFLEQNMPEATKKVWNCDYIGVSWMDGGMEGGKEGRRSVKGEIGK